ncbi:high frequency lysogenization protein HflD [Pseudidiomarina taiwanensis]|uniref:High frequency lysogenization protein HflD homolog n=1 Tax=Pseudidiomarina taiwanensis TaxID=337250 RepID=A0A432ZNB3_9GAMM|nr:high frequency lysogenization protein HflD [Pseudidiomarina taiwanensis]RUO79385.1 lysogenization regulator HflD [Pseudidiomarina taiwanensis]
MNIWQQRVLALAAAAQAAAAVKQLARTGKLADSAVAEVLVSSVLNQQSADFNAVYGAPDKVVWGLQQLLIQLGNSRQKDIEVTRYVVGMMALERKLSRTPKVGDKLSQRLQQVQQQRQHFNFDQATVNANLAGVYSDLISPLLRPLQISGKPEYLQQTQVQNQIRTALLAGIRALVLWRQLGGKRRHFLFSRQRMVRSASAQLAELRG